MAKKIVVAVMTIALVAIAIKLVYASFSGGSLKFDLDPYRALGSGAAEETAKLLGNKGQVVIIVPDTSQFKNPAVDGQLKSFQQTLTRNKGLTVADTVRFKLTPMERMATGGAAPRDLFIGALQNHPGLGAVVLFCGFPPLGLQDYETLKQSGAKVVVVSGYLPAYRKLLEGQLMHVAIVPKFDQSAAPAQEPKTLREWFERDYQVVTADSTATLPY